jgi:1-acyl-sn-glycerol-3-phosphate acyltransferase
MHRLPLADQLPYRFHPPRPSAFWVRATRGYRRRLLRGEYRVQAIDVVGLEYLAPLLEGRDGVMLTPNHCDRADGLVMLDLSDRVGRPFCSMAAYQIFAGSAGLRHWLFPRVGVFPVDREGSAPSAFKAAVEVLTSGRSPLLLFPEGEVYYLADHVTPLREGAATLALAAARRRVEAGTTVWIVPVGLKYRFPDDQDPMPVFLDRMDQLERRLTWRPRGDRPLVERIYQFAEALLSLKELEYLGAVRSGPLSERIPALQDALLRPIEARRLARHRGDPAAAPVPVRVKTLRQSCLESLADPHTTPEQARRLRDDLDDLFLAMQAYSYPGDYVARQPSRERIAETLMKLEEDLLLKPGECAAPLGPRRVEVRLGAPIDVASVLAEAGSARAAAPALTTELERRIQALLDAIGPGHPLDGEAASVAGTAGLVHSQATAVTTDE